MALRLISMLTIVVIATFLYKVWDKTKVPQDIPPEDVSSVKTIEFTCRFIHKLVNLLVYLNVEPHPYIRLVMSYLISVSQLTDVWPLFGNANNSITVERIQMAGVPVVHYKYNHQVFDPKGHAVIIYFHGGGWQWMSAESSGSTLRLLADRLQISVLSVDYRLAPEHPYPAGLNDCLSVTNYVLGHYKQLHVNPDKVIVAGDSAGGNLAAAVSLKLKKKLRLQVLVYPLMQAFDLQTPSYRENAGKLRYILNTEFVASMVTNYLGLSEEAHALLLDNKHISKATRHRYSSYIHSDVMAHLNITNVSSIDENNMLYSTNSQLIEHIETLVTDPLFSPLMSHSLDAVTDAYVITAEHDILRDDGVLYHSRLQRAHHVTSTLVNYKQGFHSFFQFAQGPTEVGVAKQAVNDLVEFLQQHIL